MTLVATRTGEVDLGSRLVIENQVVRAADLADARLTSFTAVGTTFLDTDFSGLWVGSAQFGAGQQQSLYRGCTFDRSTIYALDPGNARFERCRFLGVTLIEWVGRALEMVDCEFTGAISRSWFSGTLDAQDAAYYGRATNEFAGNNFRGASLVDVQFEGIELAAQLLPSS
jgi:uncharacterized protein YjbI with pentapeptide repeats